MSITFDKIFIGLTKKKPLRFFTTSILYLITISGIVTVGILILSATTTL
ncbi:MAG: hypothetical protein ACW96U_09195 [Candidatus Heimdallarchaeaceae archaeon]|jgi:hypothetical protein